MRTKDRNDKNWLLLAETSEKLGDRPRALALAKELARRPERLDAGQKKRLKELLLRLR